MGQMLKAIVLGLVLTFCANVALAQSEYRVKSGDTLSVEVLEDSSLNRTVLVLPDGRFSFPFAGTLQARGRTISEIQSGITSAIASNFATTPTVFVSVTPAIRAPVVNGQPAAPVTISVYFVGEVNNPGIFEVKPGTTLIQAVAISGGLSKFAATKRIQLRRAGAQRVTILNYRALQNGAASTDIVLKDGDVILVPERRLFE